MNPTLESVVYASPTVALNVNKLSRSVARRDLLFQYGLMNDVIIFKYPNFDTSVRPKKLAMPGLNGDENVERDTSVRTAMFVPKDRDDAKLGGFGIFLDDFAAYDHITRHIGLNKEMDGAEHDFRVLNILDRTPSLDPYLLKESFNLAGENIHSAYVAISDAEAREVRSLIQGKVRPIIAKAMGFGEREGAQGGEDIDNSTNQFIDFIWDTSANGATGFISAFGIDPDQAPTIFSAWKGVAYFHNEFSKRKRNIAEMLKWLDGMGARPIDRPRLQGSDKEQLEMFRNSVLEKIQNVTGNIHTVLQQYEASYKNFVEHDKPAYFSEFLFKAERYYWTLGACNGVLAQVLTTWNRYMESAIEGGLTLEKLEQLFKVCDAILRSRADDKGIVA